MDIGRELAAPIADRSRSLGAATAATILTLAALGHSTPARADSPPVGVDVNMTGSNGNFAIGVTNIGNACELVDTEMTWDGSTIANPASNTLNLEPNQEGTVSFSQDPQELGLITRWQVGIYACGDTTETDPLLPVVNFYLVPGEFTIPSSSGSGGGGGGTGGGGSGGGGTGGGSGGGTGGGGGETGGGIDTSGSTSGTSTTTTISPETPVFTPSISVSSNSTKAAVEYCKVPSFSRGETLHRLAASVVKTQADCRLGKAEHRGKAGSSGDKAGDKKDQHGKLVVVGFEIEKTTTHHGVKSVTFVREPSGKLLPDKTPVHPILAREAA